MKPRRRVVTDEASIQYKRGYAAGSKRDRLLQIQIAALRAQRAAFREALWVLGVTREGAVKVED